MQKCRQRIPGRRSRRAEARAWRRRRLAACLELGPRGGGPAGHPFSDALGPFS